MRRHVIDRSRAIDELREQVERVLHHLDFVEGNKKALLEWDLFELGISQHQARVAIWMMARARQPLLYS
jgi:hypothetical protein